jgi:hypothetical protein
LNKEKLFQGNDPSRSLTVAIVVTIVLNPPPPPTPEQQQARAAYEKEWANQKAADDRAEAERQKEVTIQKATEEKEQAASDACGADWKACADNHAIVYRWAGGPGGISPRVTCQMAATDLARNGDPEWPGFPVIILRAQARVLCRVAIFSLLKREQDFRMRLEQ